MELKEFIKTVVVEIFEGVKEAQNIIKEDGSVINPYDWHNPNFDRESAFAVTDKAHIDFEVAITVSDNTESKGSVGIFIASLGVGVQGKNSTGNESISKIKFSIPVKYPQNPKEEKYLM